ncbi:MAG: ABC transporter ATP-binding protein [Ignisphaera sp.]
MVRVKVDKIYKYFGTVEALKNVTLSVNHGEFFAILGPSGCGKTTLLRIIAGLEKPSKGRIFFDDQDITDVPAEMRDVAMVFQFYALYPTTVYNNIALPLKSKGYSKVEVNKKVHEVARLVGIEHLLNTHVDRLHPVDKQKVALARAIAKEPLLYLLDEPLTILDPVSKVIMRSELKRIQRNLNQTIIYVTHDQIEALTLADRIAVMNFGIVEQVGSPNEVYYRPKTTYVGWFLGEPGMNFIEAKIGEDGHSLKINDSTILFNPRIVEKLKDRGYSNIILGFRAENVKLSRALGEEYDIMQGVRVIGIVKVIEFMGTHYVVTIETNNGEFKVKLSTESLKSLKITEGDKVYCYVELSKLMFYDPNTSKLIEFE